MRMRMITELAALATAFSGSCDSAAAIVATSAPVIEKITVTMAAVIPSNPNGRNPPCAYRLEKSIDLPGHRPNTYAVPTARNAMIAATLMPANQNSNSPNDETENRLVAVIALNRINETSHNGTPGSQYCTIFAPAMASNPTMITQKYQYSQPTEKPAQPPRASRA